MGSSVLRMSGTGVTLRDLYMGLMIGPQVVLMEVPYSCCANAETIFVRL